MSCPNAPERGHRAGSRRGLECPYCSTGSSGSTVAPASVQSTPTISRFGTGATPSKYVPSTSTSAELTKLGEQALNLLLAGATDKRLEQALNVLIDAAAEEEGMPLDESLRGHFWCEFLEQAAVSIQELLALPGAAVDAIVDQLTAHWLPQVGMRVALKSLLNAATSTCPGIAALTALHLQIAAAAISLCPKPEQHPSLNATCAAPLTKAGISHSLASA